MVPLKSLLEWLSKTRGPNLVEATMGGAPKEALLLATTKQMVYEQDTLSMGVGLVYKPHYISTESFCSAYMHLNVWHVVASNEDSTDKLDSIHFILVSILEMSGVVPVVQLHPIFLDVSGKEVIEKTGEPLAPLWFGVSGSILSGISHLERSLFIGSPSLTSEGMPPHPCWSMSRRSSLKACGRDPKLRYLSGLPPACTGT